MAHSSPPRFLLVLYTGLGNSILKTPLVRAISHKFPGSKIDLLCGDSWGAEKIFLDSPHIGDIHICPPSLSVLHKLLLLNSLRKARYEAVFLPFDSSPQFVKLLIRLVQAKLYIAHLNLSTFPKNLLSNLFLLSRARFVPVPSRRHEIEINLDLLDAFLQHPQERNLDTYVHWLNQDVSHLLQSSNYIVIQPSARNGYPSQKIWNPKSFLELIRRLKDYLPELDIVLVGDDGDLASLPQLAHSADVVNLVGKTSINELCNILYSSRLVLSHDSGIMHLANALQVPLLALYGPTDSFRTQPLASTSQCLHSYSHAWSSMFAFNCSEDQLNALYEPYYCMSYLSVDTVYQHVLSMLAQYSIE